MKVDCRHCYKILFTNKTKSITKSLYDYIIIKKYQVSILSLSYRSRISDRRCPSTQALNCSAVNHIIETSR